MYAIKMALPASEQESSLKPRILGTTIGTPIAMVNSYGSLQMCNYDFRVVKLWHSGRPIIVNLVRLGHIFEPRAARHALVLNAGIETTDRAHVMWVEEIERYARGNLPECSPSKMTAGYASTQTCGLVPYRRILINAASMSLFLPFLMTPCG